MKWLISRRGEGETRKTAISYGNTSGPYIWIVIPLTPWKPCGLKEDFNTGDMVESEMRKVWSFKIRFRTSQWFREEFPWYKRLVVRNETRDIGRQIGGGSIIA